MRIFTLVNSAGETYDITSKSSLFYDPSGLGMSVSHSFRQVGDRWVKVDSKPQQGSIGGKIAFVSDDPYLSYYNFVDFIKKEPLILLYCPNPDATGKPSGLVYRRNVLVSKLSKTELEMEHWLNCSITFVALTPWYKYQAISNGKEEELDILKWGITWGLNWGPLSEYEKGITSDGNVNSPAKLTIYGPVTNPRWTHYVNGIEFETGKITANIDENEYLIVDNTVDPYVIQKRSAVNDSFIADLYESSDKTTKRFISLQNGTNTVSVTGDGVTNPYTKLEAYIYYDTV